MNQLILTLTAPRSGTTKFTEIIKTVPNTYVEHEGNINFQINRDIPLEMRSKMVREQIALYQSQPHDAAIQTGYIAGDGFIEEFIEQGVIPNIIILRRPMREVALSMYILGWIPGRVSILNPLFANPGDIDNSVPFFGWEYAHAYQLCYWWCIYNEHRIGSYEELMKEYGAKIWHTTLTDILNVDHVNRMLSFFDLQNIQSVSQTKSNAIEQFIANRKSIPTNEQLNELEGKVWTDIHYTPRKRRRRVNLDESVLLK